ncbi:hypothetical protein HGG72_08550 [Ochrobactrum pecoris]|uniref:Holin n=1 Tax=Brucella pecoris TaxID=867683 RepID=A0A5C5CT15_9HYPH|nr:hypothetical protein [Brucella pecoris]MBB4092478.1 hypothetical protein [Brucella pecoris]NKW80387.1 hypothetical protein [Brucella pecoris]TNV14315.1 hypothetical protein FIB18_03495 [Brucella pecoris]
MNYSIKALSAYVVLALVGAAFILIGAVAGALAQDAATSVKASTIFDVFMPYIQEAAFALIAAAVGWLLVKWTKLTGLSIEASHRDALQTALKNAVNFGLNKLEDKADKASIDVKSAVLAAGIDYVLKSVPDAVKFFGLSPERLADLLEAKLHIYPDVGELVSYDEKSKGEGAAGA